jgi:hypothetical protein
MKLPVSAASRHSPPQASPNWLPIFSHVSLGEIIFA